MIRLAANALLVFIAVPAIAYNCIGNPTRPGTVTFTPANPSSAQSVHGLYNAGFFLVTGLDVQVNGYAINLVSYGYPPPVSYLEDCAEFDVGPLPAGTYAVTVQLGGLVPPSGPNRPPVAAGTLIGTLVVAESAGSPSAIPALTPTLLAVLSGMLCLLGVSVLRRQRGGARRL